MHQGNRLRRLGPHSRGVFGLLVVVWMLVLSSYANAASVDEQILPPEQVFIAETEIQPGQILLHWQIAPGYYVYRSRFRFTTASDGLRLGAATLPAGQLKQDDHFGEVEILRDNFTITLPYEAADSGVATLITVSQGCSDLGVCYPPFEQNFSVAIGETSTPSADFSLLSAGIVSDSEFLRADQAFALRTRFREDGALLAEWDIAAGYYLYREKMAVTLAPESSYLIEAVELPRGENKSDEYFGEVEVYYHAATVVVVLAPAVSVIDAVVELEVAYQGCAEAGLCYPPMTQLVVLEAPELP